MSILVKFLCKVSFLNLVLKWLLNHIYKEAHSVYFFLPVYASVSA